MNNPVSSLDNLYGKPVITLDILNNKFNNIVSGLHAMEQNYNNNFTIMKEEFQKIYNILGNNETRINSFNGDATYYKQLRERQTPEGMYSGGFTRRKNVNKRRKTVNKRRKNVNKKR